MKFKQIITAICVAAALSNAGATVTAAVNNPVIEQNEVIVVKEKKTKEHKSSKEDKETKEKIEAIMKKWAELSDEQKNDVYFLEEQVISLKKLIADKYAKLGVIDEQTAEKIKTGLDERAKDMRENKSFPGFGGMRAGKEKKKD